MSVSPEIPTVSSDLIKKIFGEFLDGGVGVKWRDWTEGQSPPVQGHNALMLAEHIIEKAKTHQVDTYLLKRANFFKKQWDSGKCYLCGLPILKGSDGGQNEELEHILPIGQALALLGIIQENKTQFIKMLNSIDDITALLYLLEYARSHACCNQIKSSISFLIWNNDNRYDVNHTSIRHVLRRIYNSDELSLHQTTTHCNNGLWLTAMKTLNCTDFVDRQYNFIVTNFIQPIVDHLIRRLVEDNNHRFTQLIWITNQAMSVPKQDEIWRRMGADIWKGSPVSKLVFLERIQKIAMTIISTGTGKGKGKDIQYENTTGIVLKDIFSLAKTDSGFKKQFDLYTKSHNQQSSSRPPRTAKQLDTSVIPNFLKIDMAKYARIYEEFFRERNGISLTAVDFVWSPFSVDKSYLYWGNFYMEKLIDIQAAEFIFREDMIPALAEMLVNVNNYTIFNIYLWIIWYQPFSSGNMIPAIGNELNEALDIVYSGKDKYIGIHDKFLSSFSRFNYNIVINNVPYDLKELNQFINYFLRIPGDYEAAKTMMTMIDFYYAEYPELPVDVQIAPGSNYTIDVLSTHTTPASTPALSRNPSSQPLTGLERNLSTSSNFSTTPFGTYYDPRGDGTGMISVYRNPKNPRFDDEKEEKRAKGLRRGGFKSKKSLTMSIKQPHYYGKVNRNKLRRNSNKTKNKRKKTKRNKTISKRK
tara:strand:- start:24591 stop:26684 length:2094 start_codon:yes stop_codon:yes gene_type:complete